MKIKINITKLININNTICKNVRINIPNELVNYMNIEIGGLKTDTIYYNIYEVLLNYHGLQNIPMSGYYCIPFDIFCKGFPTLEYQDLNLFIEFKKCDLPETFIIKMDLYQIVNNVSLDGIEFITKQLQYCGQEETQQETQQESFKYRLNYNHVSELVIVEYYDKNIIIDEIQINHFIDEKCYETKEKLYNKIGGFHVYKFKTFINFSTLDKSLIISKFSIKNIYAINHNIFRFAHGMTRLYYAN